MLKPSQCDLQACTGSL